MTVLLRTLVVLLLAGVLPAMPALAYSEPIEPTWQGGYWEDDDFDYVVLLVTNLQAALSATPHALPPALESVEVAPLIVADAPVIERPLPYRRGPPSA